MASHRNRKQRSLYMTDEEYERDMAVVAQEGLSFVTAIEAHVGLTLTPPNDIALARQEAPVSPRRAPRGRSTAEHPPVPEA